MTMTPRKLGSHTTTNRGIEAKEIEIANTRLDVEPSSYGAGGRQAAPGDARTSSPPTTDQSSASYVQVVVQKQRRDPRRLPTASSPTQPELRFQRHVARGEDPLPTAVLLACPAFAALHQQSWNGISMLDAQKNKEETVNKEMEAKRQSATFGVQKEHGYKLRTEKTKNSMWLKMSNIACGKEEYWSDDGPERVEVYQFEHGCEMLWSRSATRVTRVERLGRALAGPASRLFAELLAVLRLVFALPVNIILQLERCVLSSVRAAVCGALQTAADEALKPALALGYNALARPPLVLAAQTAAALREALRPLCLALVDAAEPFARLLAGFRLVHIETRPCSHNV